MAYRATATLLLALVSLTGCVVDDGGDADGAAAHPGVRFELEMLPTVSIDDEFGTEVGVRLHLDHLGGPDVETLEVLSASLQLDLEDIVELELEIPEDHPGFDGLIEGETLDLLLRDEVDMTHEDWGLCTSGADESDDELRVTLSLEVRVTPGANDEDDVETIEHHAVDLACVFVG